MANVDVLTAVYKSLKAYLNTEVPELLKITDEFPDPSELLKYPALTIFIGKPVTTPYDPFVLSQGATNGSNQALVARVVAEWDIPLQLDLWCNSKIQRRTIHQKLFNAINKRQVPMGLDLLLTNYFSQYASFQIRSFAPKSDEASSQRKEWRYLIDVVCTVNHIMEKMEYVAVTLDNQSSITNGVIP